MKKTTRTISTLVFSLIALSLSTEISVAVRAAAPERERKEVSERPSEWMWRQRAYPYESINPRARIDAVRQAETLRSRARAKGGSIANAQWQQAGPTNIGGRIVDIEFNPQNPAIVYAAAAQGGVWRSDDTGKTWRPVFDDVPMLSMGDIAIDPQHPSTIYAGTGEANSQHNAFPGLGLYKSTDGGATWSHSGLENTDAIGRILVHPKNPQRVYVAAVGSAFIPHPERGVWRSDDAGQTWKRILFVNDSTGAIDIAFNPSEPDLMYAAMWQRSRRPDTREHYGTASGVYRSTDGGDTWELLGTANGLPDGHTQNVGRIGLATAPSTDKVYAYFSDGYGYLGLWGSSTYGETWQRLDPTNSIGLDSANFMWYFGQVRVDPLDDKRVYVLDVDFARSDDGGTNWHMQGYQERELTGLHVDHHALAFHPHNPDYIIAGHDGGISISRNRGETWQHVEDLPVTQFYEIGLDPTYLGRLYGGTQDNSTIRTATGLANDWHQILGGDGFYVIVDPLDPNIIYAESQYGNLVKLEEQEDGTFRYFYALSGIPPATVELRNWSTPVVMDHRLNSVLYYGNTRVYRTTNAAETWEPISEPLGKHIDHHLIGTITAIAVAPSDYRVLYAGTDDGNVWVSDNGGVKWRNIAAGLPERWVTRIVVDMHDPAKAYITYSGLKWREQIPYIFRTSDMGVHWEDITANLPAAPVNAFAIDPRRSSVLYAGLDVGVYVSFNAGGSWEPLGTGMPIVPIADIKIPNEAYELVVGTHGRSMYRIDIRGVVSAEENKIPDGIQVHNFPNPCSDYVFFEYELPEAGFVALEIYDIAGRKLASPVAGLRAAGQFSARWNCVDGQGQALLPGVYLYKYTVRHGGAEKQLTGKITVVR